MATAAPTSVKSPTKTDILRAIGKHYAMHGGWPSLLELAADLGVAEGDEEVTAILTVLIAEDRVQFRRAGSMDHIKLLVAPGNKGWEQHPHCVHDLARWLVHILEFSSEQMLDYLVSPGSYADEYATFLAINAKEAV